MVLHCAVFNCTRSQYQLNKWKDTRCDRHGCNYGMGCCICPPPFVLHTFPTERHPHERNIWIKNINRRNQDGSRWEPQSFHRVCSQHFRDGQSTPQYPYPTENLGYSPYRQDTHRPLPKKRENTVNIKGRNKKRKKTDGVCNGKNMELTKCSVPVAEPDGEGSHVMAGGHDHSYAFVCERCSSCMGCEGCAQRQKTIRRLQEKINRLERQYASPKTSKPEKTVEQKLLNTDKKVSLNTGLPNKQALSDLYHHVLPRAEKLQYWRGKKRVVSTKVKRNFRKTPKKSGPTRKLSVKEELTLTLMKLRLNLTNEFLSDLFGVSSGTVSAILNTWLKFLAREMKALIFWPEKSAVLETIPPSLKRLYPQLRCTLDCSELYIERPRHLETQALTWSDYKHHNTVKFLVGIAPNGCITFLSDCWGGRASDRHITRASGFLKLVDPGDIVLADRGFPIQEDLLMVGAHLKIPPPSAGMEQHSQDNVRKTKKVANARIHVERAIGRLKCFRILQGVLPISLVANIDNILTVCSGICNLQPPLVSK